MVLHQLHRMRSSVREHPIFFGHPVAVNQRATKVFIVCSTDAKRINGRTLLHGRNLDPFHVKSLSSSDVLSSTAKTLELGAHLSQHATAQALTNFIQILGDEVIHHPSCFALLQISQLLERIVDRASLISISKLQGLVQIHLCIRSKAIKGSQEPLSVLLIPDLRICQKVSGKLSVHFVPCDDQWGIQALLTGIK